MNNCPRRRSVFSSALICLFGLALAALTVVPLFAASPSLAAATSDATAPKQSVATGAIGVFLPFGNVSLPAFIGRLIRYAAGLVGVVALLMFIYAGILYMTARGSEEQVTKAKNIMLWSVLGIAAVLSAYGLVKLLYTILNTSVGQI